jgi:RNA polymerase sigma factor (sigma-70 family)
MPPRLPLEVHSLLNSDSQAERDSAWESFLASHSRLILYVARSVTRDGDETLDAYTWALERLKEDESRRLRGFSEATGTLFSTWLVVVIRRLCLDFLRHKRGRLPKAPGGRASSESRQLRRRLLDLAGESAVLETLSADGPDPGASLEARELHEAVEAAVDTLPPADRLLLSFRFEDNLSAPEIARVMNFPSQFHVYRRLNTVLKHLRERLGEAGIEDAAG